MNGQVFVTEFQNGHPTRVSIDQSRADAEELTNIVFVLPNKQQVSVTIEDNGTLTIRSTTGLIKIVPQAANAFTLITERF